MSTTWQWAKANPDAAARLIRELGRENAERGLRLVTIEEIIDDSHRSNKAKVLALKWMLGRKEAQP